MPVLFIVCTSSSWTKYKADWPLHLLLIVSPSQTRCSPSKLNWALVCPSRDAHENLNNNKQKYKGVWSAYSQKWFFKFHTSSFIIQSIRVILRWFTDEYNWFWRNIRYYITLWRTSCTVCTYLLFDKTEENLSSSKFLTSSPVMFRKNVTLRWYRCPPLNFARSDSVIVFVSSLVSR